jgi:ATP-dependent helicase/nuclease subunit A
VSARDSATVPDDRAVRLAALDPTASFIVQAPAGSGKTELLIQRMLSLLARVEHPSEVLAITFTRKAAGEMRERLIAALHAAQTQSEPNASPARERWRLAREVVARDAALGWQLLQRPALLNIDTFDAFSLRVMRIAPHDPSFANASLATLEEDASAMHREAARRAVMEASESQDVAAVAALLHALDNRVDDIIALLAGLLGKRAQWMDRLIDDSDEAIDAMQNIVVANIESCIAALQARWPSGLTARMNALAAYAADNVEDPSRKDRLQISASASFSSASLASLPEWIATADFLLIGEGTWRRQFNKTSGFPAASDKGLTSEEKEGRKAAKDAIEAFIAELQALPNAEALRSSFLHVRTLPDAEAIAAHEPMLRAALRVLKLAAGELLVIERTRAVTDFSGVSLAAKLALIEHRDEVFARLEAGIRHILVDEFQDTNPAQASLIETLVEDWRDGDGRTLFLVGDPMQSIYAFRDADVGIFVDAWSRGIASLQLRPLTLSANYRSRPAIVDWVNATLEPVFANANENDNTPTVAFARAAAVRENAAARRPELFTYASAEEEARAIVADIVRVKASSPNDSIAILVRAKQHAAAILRELQAARIDFTAREMASWSDRALIRDLLSLTYVLAQPSDQLSWYAWLRSPMIGLTLASLARIGEWQEIHGHEMPAPLRDEALFANLPTDEQLRISRGLSALARARAEANLATLSHRVHEVFRLCGGDAIAASPEAKEEVDAYLAFLDTQIADGFLPPRDIFETLVKKQYRSFSSTTNEQSATDATPVEVLTMHKAKGLEWHHVYLPHLDCTSRSEMRELIQWNFVRERQYQLDDGVKSFLFGGNLAHQPARLLVAAKESRRRSANSVYDWVHERRVEARASETKRLLYVAVTRARERLVLSGSAARAGKPPNARSLAALIDWPMLEERPRAAHETPLSLLPAQSSRVEMRGSLTRLAHSLEMTVCDVSSRDHAANGDVVNAYGDNALPHDNEIALGIVGHKLIEGLARAHASSRKFEPSRAVIRLWLEREGSDKASLDRGAETLIRACERMRTSEHFAFIHRDDHREAADELTLALSDPLTLRELRVDRTFVTHDNVRWVVDYKFAAPSSDDEHIVQSWLREQAKAYAPQLDAYTRAFERIDSGRAAKRALYFPIVDRLLGIE